jgi:hypothetical protein
MLKLSSAAVGKIVLGQDFHHFDSLDAPIHRLPMAIAESLVLNKKVSSMGEWYSHLPFGDPKKLRDLGQEIADTIITSMKEAKGSGTEDLPLQEAALKAADVIGMDSVIWKERDKALTCRRLPQPSRRLKRRPPPSREHRPSTNSRSRRRLHHNLVSPLLAGLRARSLRRHASPLAARIGRPRLQRRHHSHSRAVGRPPHAGQIHQRNAAPPQPLVPTRPNRTKRLHSTGWVQSEKGHSHHRRAPPHPHEPQDLG